MSEYDVHDDIYTAGEDYTPVTAPDPIRARLDEDEVAPGIPYSAALQAWNEASDDTTLGEIRRRAAEIAALGEPR